MGKLGKILAPIVAVLAIAAAVLGFLVNSGFKKYQERASKMAKGLVDTGAKLDAQTNTGKASSVKFTAAAPGVKESGTLSFADFKADPNKFNSTVGAVSDIADKIVAQRNDLTDAVKDISIKLGMKEDFIAADDMKDIGTYQARIALAKSYVDAYEQRDKEFVAYLKKFANSVGRNLGAIDRKPVIKTEKVAPPKKAASEDSEEGEESEPEEEEPVETQVAKFESNSAALDAVNNAIASMKNCRDSYEKSIRSVKAVISNYGEWKADVSGISERNYETVLVALASDLAVINRKLGEVNQVKAELARKNEELNRSKGEIESLKKKNEDAGKEIEKITGRVKELTKLLGGDESIAEVMDDDNGPVVTLKDVKLNTKGKVIIDNKEWNYVITDLGNRKVAVGAKVAFVSADGSYIGSGAVTKVKDGVSLVEITRRINKSGIPVGSTAVISAVEDADGDDDK
ncbi:MAG: hypothetical protein IJS15_15630 [Victivallales bacterium]|nr:hypothetical protein [Victivallales bacterium]